MTRTACKMLVNAIDAYIAKSDKILSDQLAAEGYAEPKDAVDHIEEL